MKIFCSLKKIVLFWLFILLPSASFAEDDAGYEAAISPKQCPADGDENAAWGFAACNCTSYVAYRLNLNNVQDSRGGLFKNYWWGGIHFGDAGNWYDEAGKVGIRRDHYPAVGSVAYWSTHVAYTQHLFTHPNDGRLTSIGIMEYNYDSFQYTYRRIGVGRGTESVGGYPSNFLHFEEKGRDTDDTNATCVAGLSVKPFEDTHDGSFCWVHNGDDADCENASEYYYFDYRTCERHNVSSEGNYSPSEYCDRVGSNPGYTAHIGNWFPESIAPSANGTDFASCPQGGTGTGNSREVSGRLPKERKKFLQKASGNG